MSPTTPSLPNGPSSPELSPALGPQFPAAAVEAALRMALDEDGMAPEWAPGRAWAPPPGRTAESGNPGAGPRRRVDLTSDHSIQQGARAQGRLVAKAEGVLAGLPVFARALEMCDGQAHVQCLARDGDRVQPGQEVLRVEGRSRALLYAERTGLNFVQRLSGVATLTARYVQACAGRARVLDTRKTTPNLRELEKYAVRCGGGVNHRFGLYDEAMVKNNHADLAGVPLLELLIRLRAALGPAARITSEARDFDEACAGVQGDADVVLLDNFSVAEWARCSPLLRERARGRTRPLELEASGGIHLGNIGDVAASGVDRISVGAMTHSAPALDFSFYLRPA